MHAYSSKVYIDLCNSYITHECLLTYVHYLKSNVYGSTLSCCEVHALISLIIKICLQITVQDEGRDMWQVYLGLKEYTAALEACRDLAQRDSVYAAQVLGLLCPYLPRLLHYDYFNKWFQQHFRVSLVFFSRGCFEVSGLGLILFILYTQAEAAFEVKDYERAGSFWAKVHKSYPNLRRSLTWTCT